MKRPTPNNLIHIIALVFAVLLSVFIDTFQHTEIICFSSVFHTHEKQSYSKKSQPVHVNAAARCRGFGQFFADTLVFAPDKTFQLKHTPTISSIFVSASDCQILPNLLRISRAPPVC